MQKRFKADNGVAGTDISVADLDQLRAALEAEGVAAFGPNAAAAALEGSKGFMKDLCAREGIPTAAYRRFTEADAAKAYIAAQGAPIVAMPG